MTRPAIGSVPDPVRSLTELRRVLKPGGQLRFFEHVRSANPLIGKVQDLITPVWAACGGGCHLNRNTGDAITAAGFEIDQLDRFSYRPLKFVHAHGHILGRAHKPREHRPATMVVRHGCPPRRVSHRCSLSALHLERGPRPSLSDMSTTANADLMTVAGLATRVGVKPDTVRYYERIGLLPAPRRTAADHRRYDETAVDLMRFIQGAQRLGLRLTDIRQLVELRRTGECPCGPTATVISRRLDELDEQIEQLVRMRDELRHMADRIPADDCPDPLPGTWRPRREVS